MKDFYILFGIELKIEQLAWNLNRVYLLSYFFLLSKHTSCKGVRLKDRCYINISNIVTCVTWTQVLLQEYVSNSSNPRVKRCPDEEDIYYLLYFLYCLGSISYSQDTSHIEFHAIWTLNRDALFHGKLELLNFLLL